MSPPIKRPWYMFYPLAGMVLISIIWSGYWYVAFTQAQRLVAERRAEFASRGMELSCSREAWGGYPFRFEFQCDGMSLNYAGNALKTGKALAIAQAYNPFHLLFKINGPTSIQRGEATVATATHDDALVSITMTANGDWDMSSDVANVSVRDQFTSDTFKFFARKLDGHIEFAGTAMGAKLTQGVAIDTAEFKAALIDNTSIDLSLLKLTSGTTTFEGAGNIELDASHRIAGKLSTQTNDLNGLLKLAAPLLQLNEKDQEAIRDLIVAHNADPNSTLQRADFIGRDGAIFWGLFKLADSPPLY
jgi:hypothetical protein